MSCDCSSRLGMGDHEYTAGRQELKLNISSFSLDLSPSHPKMWKPAIPIYRATELPLLRAGRCLSCQVLNSAAYTTRLHSQPSSLRRYASKTEAKKVKANSNAVRPSSTQPEARRPPPGAIQFKQNPCPKQSAQPGDADFQPPTLDRAIGVPRPPREWENTGIDPRSIRQRRDDFVNYDRHVARRQELYELYLLLVLLLLPLVMVISPEQGYLKRFPL